MLDIEERVFARSFSSRRLRLLILPTERCNFRCTYCYEDFALGRMKKEIRNGLLLFLERRFQELDELEIDWFGGEPLLVKDDILEMSSAIHRSCVEHSVKLRGSITTNGYFLSYALAEKLVQASVSRFLVTIDGPQPVHDTRRRMANGRPTYDAIVKNIETLLRSDLRFNLTLRIHYDPSTYDTVREFARLQVARWAEDERVSVVFAHLENLSEHQPSHIQQMSLKERSAALSELRSFVPQAAAKETDFYVCYAAQANAFVIRADGKVSKCTVALTDDKNFVGELKPNGDLLIDNDRHRSWLEPWVTGNPKHLACPYSAIAGSEEAWSSTI